MEMPYVKKHKLPFGDYAMCDICRQDWNTFITFEMFDHSFIMCPECFEKFKAKINKIGEK